MLQQPDRMLPADGPPEQSLQGEIERLRQVVAVHSEALLLDRAIVYAVDLLDDCFTYVSPHVEELTGFTTRQWHCAGAFSGMMARCHVDDLPLIQSAMDRLCRRDCSPRSIELKYRWKDNFDRWRWCNDCFRILVDDNAQPVHMIGCIREVTEQIETARLQQAWRAAEPAARPDRNRATDSLDWLATMTDTAGLGLTRIQRRVLELILAGMSNKQIALRLRRSIRTIEDHRFRIMRKLGAENAVDLVRKVFSHRAVSSEPPHRRDLKNR